MNDAGDPTQIARRLREIGALMRLAGENPFKAKAYEAGADAVEAAGSRLTTLVESNRLTELPGVGTAIAATITELAHSGRSVRLDELRAAFPAGVLELANIPGMTVARVRALHDALGIESREQLKAALEAGLVAKVKGFGPATQEKIARGLAEVRDAPVRIPLTRAEEAAAPLLDAVRAVAGVSRAEVAGDLRRMCETTDRLELVVAAERPQGAAKALSAEPSLLSAEVAAPSSVRARSAAGVPIHIELAGPNQFAAAWLRRTGSAGHVEKLEGLAAKQGVDLAKLGDESEAEIYRRLGMAFVPPELRENEGEIEAALAGDTFEDLLTREDIRGMVHCHTTYSDGRNTILEMARAAEAMGVEYMTITDHSPTASYAGGVTLDRLRRQWDEIAAAQDQVSIRLLRGTESDILGDGALDYPDNVLEQLDVVIASVHARMKMDENQMTERLTRAMRLPVFKIWGHALGRLILRRDPIACRVEEILDAVAESPAAIEVNGDPDRLDLAPQWIRSARRRGIKFVISVDAHSIRDLQNLPYGVAMARRGGIRRDEVLNARPLDQFRAAVRPVQH